MEALKKEEKVKHNLFYPLEKNRGKLPAFDRMNERKSNISRRFKEIITGQDEPKPEQNNRRIKVTTESKTEINRPSEDFDGENS